MKFRRVAGFEGDIHDSVKLRVQGTESELVLFTANPTWGPVKRQPDAWPTTDSTFETSKSTRHWQCSEGDGDDFRLSREGRHWRLLTFPLGFAEYKNVPRKVAEQFDRVLDSICRQKLGVN